MIDSDLDPECFVSDDDIVCRSCRDDAPVSKRAFATFEDFMAHVADERANEEKLHGSEV